jgi:hypothetical protein
VKGFALLLLSITHENFAVALQSRILKPATGKGKEQQAVPRSEL